MEAKDWLDQLPPPDPEGEARVWRRFQQSRSQERSRRWTLGLPLLVGGLAAAAALWTALPVREDSRTVALHATSAPAVHEWSEQVRLHLDGHGVAQGRSKDLRLQWESGTVRAEVTPHTGTQVEVVTEEGSVRVVGTVFSVRRDALGTTTWVDRGRVAVSCGDGWVGEVGPEDGPHTCLPTRPGGMLGRADALADQGAGPDEVLEALDLGLVSVAADSPVRGELLARRVRFRALSGETDGALQDADAYLASGLTSRRQEVLASAARLALTRDGCGGARVYLEPLEPSGTAEDHVLLAHCLVDADPVRARRLAAEALGTSETIDPGWRAWATALVGGE